MSAYCTALVLLSSILQADLRNNSAWNQRFFVISKTSAWTKAVKAAEIDYGFSFIKSAPNNQSPWLYVKGCDTSASDHTLIQLCILQCGRWRSAR